MWIFMLKHFHIIYTTNTNLCFEHKALWIYFDPDNPEATSGHNQQ